jgi:hypothetical protein
MFSTKSQILMARIPCTIASHQNTELGPCCKLFNFKLLKWSIKETIIFMSKNLKSLKTYALEVTQRSC